jgi:hypothetical protein
LSSTPEQFNELENEIKADKHLLKGGNSTTAPEDVRESVLIYDKGDLNSFFNTIKALQAEKTALQAEKTALQEEKTALIKFQAIIASKGILIKYVYIMVVVLSSTANFLNTNDPP